MDVEKKRHCAEFEHWEMGDVLGTPAGRDHGFVVDGVQQNQIKENAGTISRVINVSCLKSKTKGESLLVGPDC